jgi:hypothetical protein
MLEANLSYYVHVHQKEIYGLGVSDQHTYTHINQYRNVGIQIGGRYALYTLQSLKWKYYPGIALNADNYRGLHNDVLVQTAHYTSWHSFAELEYYGKINRSRRISVQYNLNYLVSSRAMDVLNTSPLVIPMQMTSE